VAVLARRLEPYCDPIRRAFAAYDIPFFLDRREPVGHHPLAELTRSALRTLALQWQTDDWFCALKTGLVHDSEAEVDRLENEALARGWKGKDWAQPLQIPDDVELETWAESLRKRVTGPFLNLELALRSNVSGEELAAALVAFWRQLRVGNQLERWTTESGNLVHTTFWEQMQTWVENIALAFSNESLPCRDWLPIVEAGLASQTVGVIPPALDQVMVGAVDRSRNPDLRVTILLGINESVFPSPPAAPTLLSESDRDRLLELQVMLRLPARRRLGQERYLGYVACTRARDRLVLTYALRDENDRVLNPSPFITDLKRLFPGLQTESLELPRPLAEVEHANDLLAQILQQCSNPVQRAQAFAPFLGIPAFAGLVERIERFRSIRPDERMSAAVAEALYGETLATSVTRLEHFAGCPFRFFISSGLRAEQRKIFELDVREQGSFQHEVLALFHRDLLKEGKRWRDVTPGEARERIATAVSGLIEAFRSGLLMADDQSLFTTRNITLALQDFIEIATFWMEQYGFDPQAVELGFGQEDDPLPDWKLPLDEQHQLLLRGKIDRVDLWRRAEAKDALCVVIDYKINTRKLDTILMAHGIQLQLVAYLNVLRGLPEAAALFRLERIVPAGVFYVNLRGRYKNGGTRRDVFGSAIDAHKLAYKHTGRFDAGVVRQLDRRGVPKGDQFNYSFNQNGELSKGSREALEDAAFREMLDAVEHQLVKMGRAIFVGIADVDPYRKGNVSACDQCHYQGSCRIEPWTHAYRTLKKTGV
jgi:ATP-dependent helicase/nuclease subunit B